MSGSRADRKPWRRDRKEAEALRLMRLEVQTEEHIRSLGLPTDIERDALARNRDLTIKHLARNQ